MKLPNCDSSLLIARKRRNAGAVGSNHKEDRSSMLGVWHLIQQCKANPCVYIPCKAVIALVKLSCRFGQISINISRWGTKIPPVTLKKILLSWCVMNLTTPVRATKCRFNLIDYYLNPTLYELLLRWGYIKLDLWSQLLISHSPLFLSAVIAYNTASKIKKRKTLLVCYEKWSDAEIDFEAVWRGLSALSL
jgi:hypothetical protein